MKIPDRIASAKQALKLSQGIKSIWSHEALTLNQRTLIYQTELMEQLVRNKPRRDLEKSRGWHDFLKKCLKQKISVQQAQNLWRSLRDQRQLPTRSTISLSK
jgi:hypothetical protein